MTLHFKISRIIKTLLGIAASLTCIYLILQSIRLATGHDHIIGLIPMFDLDEEFNIPSTFAFILFLMASILTVVICKDANNRHNPLALHWAGLSLGFLWLSLDEILSIHEAWTIKFEINDLRILSWHLLYVALAVMIVPLYIRFLKNIDAKLRKNLFSAAAVYLTGVVVFELLGNIFSNGGRDIINAPYILSVAVEETLEMIGLIMLIKTLLRYIADHIKTITLNIDK